MKELKILGNNIRKKRLQCAFSQEALAYEADVHRTYVGAVERGEKNVSINSLLKIAKALKITLNDLTKGL